MEGVTKMVLVVLVIFLAAFLSGAEGGRDLSAKGDQEVYNPQAFRFRHFPWWWWGIHNSETTPKDKAKGEIMHMEVPRIGGMAGQGYFPQVDDGMVSTKGEDVYNPQAFWFPHFPWWHFPGWGAGIHKIEIAPNGMAKEVDGMASTKGEEVYNPQAFWFPHFPWWHFPGWGAGIHKTEIAPKDMAKGETMNPEVPNIDGMPGQGYFSKVDGMVSTKGEEVYNPQAFWFPHFPCWHFPGWGAGIHKTEIAPKGMAKGETMNSEVPNIDGIAGHSYP